MVYTCGRPNEVALRRELGHGTPHGDPAYGIHLRELRLGGNAAARGILAALDIVLEVLHHLLVKRGQSAFLKLHAKPSKRQCREKPPVITTLI